MRKYNCTVSNFQFHIADTEWEVFSIAFSRQAKSGPDTQSLNGPKNIIELSERIRFECLSYSVFSNHI